MQNPFYRVSESSNDSGVESHLDHHHDGVSSGEYPEVAIRIETADGENESESHLVALSDYEIPLDAYWEVNRDR